MCGSMCSHGEKCAGRCVDLGLFLVRLAVGVPFLMHGIQKLQGMDMVVGFFDKLGLPAFLAWLVAIIETVGGAALILGAFTGISGTLLAIIMVGAVLTAKKAAPFLGGWEIDFVLFAAALGAAFLGSGRYSVMSLIKKGEKGDGKSGSCCGGGGAGAGMGQCCKK